jgi:hypothetical protein
MADDGIGEIADLVPVSERCASAVEARSVPGATARRTARTPGVLPAAPVLPTAVLGAQFAPRVRREQFAWIEPVLRDRAGEDGAELSVEVAQVGAAVMPEGTPVGHVRQAQDLLDAAVAVRRDDQDASRELRSGRRRQSKHDVVVKLALRPVRNELIASKPGHEVAEKDAEHPVASKAGDLFVTGRVRGSSHTSLDVPPGRCVHDACDPGSPRHRNVAYPPVSSTPTEGPHVTGNEGCVAFGFATPTCRRSSGAEE